MIEAAQARPRAEQRPGDLGAHRLQGTRLVLADLFLDPPNPAVTAEIRNVLQHLNWDPSEGREVRLLRAGGTVPPVAGGVAADRGGTDQLWRFVANAEIAAWLRGHDLSHGVSGRGGRRMPALYLLELCACVMTEAAPDNPVLAAIRRYKARGGRRLYAGGNGFFWRISYHLATPLRLGLGARDGRLEPWRTEGGQYGAGLAREFPGVWRRRPSAGPGPAPGNERPAETFDPASAHYFEGLDRQDVARDQRVDLGPDAPVLRLRPCLGRLGWLCPLPGNALEAPAAFDRSTLAGAGRSGIPPARAATGKLAAWYRPAAGTLGMTWTLSPPLVT